jgi:hypothetical protein
MLLSLLRILYRCEVGGVRSSVYVQAALFFISYLVLIITFYTFFTVLFRIYNPQKKINQSNTLHRVSRGLIPGSPLTCGLPLHGASTYRTTYPTNRPLHPSTGRGTYSSPRPRMCPARHFFQFFTTGLCSAEKTLGSCTVHITSMTTIHTSWYPPNAGAGHPGPPWHPVREREIGPMGRPGPATTGPAPPFVAALGSSTGMYVLHIS